MRKFIKIMQNNFIILLLFVCILFSLILGNINESTENHMGNIVLLCGLIFMIISFVILDKTKKFKKEYAKVFVFGVLFFVYIGYILNTNCATRQHDTRSLNWENGGHFGYIEYILEKGKLPDFNPTEKWCFTNPPLFYIISAIFVKFQNIIGRDGYQAIENLQYLNVFYIMIFNVYIYRIMSMLEMKKMKNYISLCIGLSPAIVYLTGSLNNDALSITLVTMAIFYTIKWYRDSEFFDLLKIALTISLALMTKINSAIIAIPIGFIFLIKLLKEKHNFKRYFLYYCVFPLIAIPIGLWFPIKNLVKYDIPITYVQTVVEKENNDGYIGNRTAFERFFKADVQHLQTINLKFEKGKSDYNIFLTTLKSFIVDEQLNNEVNIIETLAAYLLLMMNVNLIICFFISILKNDKHMEDIFLYLIFILEIIFYIKFCFDYPYAFSMNFRYIVPIIIVMGIEIGKMCDNNMRMQNIVQNLIAIYSLASIILFINI